jgi:transcriptional regulator with XRE-family HTH domain
MGGVGREIRRLREEKGWSQAKLAGAADMGVSGISQIETGARNPSAVTLTKIADALEVSVADLFPKGQPRLPDFEEQSRNAEELLSKAQEVARRDEEKSAQAGNRLLASQGVLRSTDITDFEEDRFRAELRARGFPDEYFEGFIWPLVVENMRLKEKNALLRDQIKEREQAY